MKTDVQKPNEWTIPDGVGLVLRSQMKSETFDIDGLIAAATSRYESEYRRRARYALGMPIPEQSEEELARRRMSVAMRAKYLEQRESATERKRKQRHQDAIKAGRSTRSYKKRRK